MLDDLDQLVDVVEEKLSLKEAKDKTLDLSISKLDTMLKELVDYANEDSVVKRSSMPLNLNEKIDHFANSYTESTPEVQQATNNKPHLLNQYQDLLIGIDLGTACSAVMSNRGDLFSFESVVGYVKDIIGSKLLKADYLVGDEVSNYSFLDINYPLNDGVIKQEAGLNYDAARKLIQHAVELVKPYQGQRTCAVIGIPANTSQANQKLLLELAKEQLDIAIVLSEPFMVAYGLLQLNDAIIVDIGAGTIDICALKGRLPEAKDQVSITKAGNYIDALLMDMIEVSHPRLSLGKKYVRGIKEKHAFVGEPLTRVELNVHRGGERVIIDISDEIRRACESIVPDLLEQLKILIAGIEVTLQSRAIANIILSGGGSRIEGLDKMIINGLRDFGNIQVSRVQDIVYPGAAGALKLACELPPEYWTEFTEKFDDDD